MLRYINVEMRKAGKYWLNTWNLHNKYISLFENYEYLQIGGDNNKLSRELTTAMVLAVMEFFRTDPASRPRHHQK